MRVDCTTLTNNPISFCHSKIRSFRCRKGLDHLISRLILFLDFFGLHSSEPKIISYNRVTKPLCSPWKLALTNLVFCPIGCDCIHCCGHSHLADIHHQLQGRTETRISHSSNLVSKMGSTLKIAPKLSSWVWNLNVLFSLRSQEAKK
jgi:hypothetical protein